MSSGPDHARDETQAQADAPPLEAWTDRYRTFLALTGDGIARFELDPPLRVDAPEEEQVERILKHSRVAECNEVFARMYGRVPGEMTGRTIGGFVPSDDPARLKGIREFIRSRYRLMYSEEAHALGEGSTRWISGSALGAGRGRPSARLLALPPGHHRAQAGGGGSGARREGPPGGGLFRRPAPADRHLAGAGPGGRRPARPGRRGRPLVHRRGPAGPGRFVTARVPILVGNRWPRVRPG